MLKEGAFTKLCLSAACGEVLGIAQRRRCDAALRRNGSALFNRIQRPAPQKYNLLNNRYSDEKLSLD
jgi:hypothetical protein